MTAFVVPDHASRVLLMVQVDAFSMVLTLMPFYPDMMAFKTVRSWEFEPSPASLRPAIGVPGSHGPGRAL